MRRAAADIRRRAKRKVSSDPIGAEAMVITVWDMAMSYEVPFNEARLVCTAMRWS